MADIFSVIADPTRRHLLSLLLERYVDTDSSEDQVATTGEISVSELVAQLELSQPTVSKHLKVLRDAGLVVVREEGQHRFYALDSAPLEEVEDWLIPFLSADFDEFSDDPERSIDADWDHLADAAKSAANTAGQKIGQTVADTTDRAKVMTSRVTSRIQDVVSRFHR